MAKKPKPSTRSLCAAVPVVLLRKFEEAALEEKRTKSAMLRIALEDFLERRRAAELVESAG